ncbi:hypothetical protein LWF15_33810 [Kineosporia rhizophila]|uniref:CBU_0592 family membrane protein n=1 Tax=Kineosporia TaxID=49184 RepID=UPI001E420782|nr:MULTISPECIES: hypothetical protein [Kineosporia]MCE0540483.1 hypothetical protein [Kineosporia rhizophila]GLY15298.1 hypothetical protein Kisp01_23130 [Kineosporia sp. NBRC 101677]
MAALLGWLGTIGTIGAYVLLSRGRWSSTSLRYSLLNGLGGVAGAIGSGLYGAWPSAASNLAWAAIGLHAVAVELLERRRTRAAAQQLNCHAADFVPAS